MCGIAGQINFSAVIDDTDLKQMCQLLSQRGPDGEGIYLQDKTSLGHRRLSIIDLETGDQPMYSQDGNVALVFNGEIYNFKELRDELIAEGIDFRTTSDTEVIIKLYELKGLSHTLDRIEGMFAFALSDLKNDRIFMVRDRFGEKPLFYTCDDMCLRFASELKALVSFIDNKELDREALNLYLSLTYIPAPYTIFHQVRKLEAGHYLEIDKTGIRKKNQYYSLAEKTRHIETLTDFKSASVKLLELLGRSVAQRMTSDVPIGSFLSGGIDSSIITALMAKHSEASVKTFSIGFHEKEYDESSRAQLVVDHVNTEHKVHFLSYEDVVNDIDEIIGYFDEPFGDSSALPSNYVAYLARKDVKVVLTGDCADELFGGYEKYLAEYYSSKYKKLPKPMRSLFNFLVNHTPHTRFTNSLLRRVKKVIAHSELSGLDQHYAYMCLGFSDDERKELINHDFWKDSKKVIKQIYNSLSDASEANSGAYTDVMTVLEGDMLAKVDRMCMRNSLEARVPFLDSKIVEFAFSLPKHFKIKNRVKKYILKKTFGHLLPKETIGFRKKGFGVPVDYWFKNQLKNEAEKLFEPSVLEKQGIFNPSYVQKLWQEHQAGIQNHKGQLWNLFVFQKWYQKHHVI
jgi:asparagine synthase (glutamine-hydrolysing)